MCQGLGLLEIGFRPVSIYCLSNAMQCVEASCHKRFVVFSCNQHRRLLYQRCVITCGRYPWSNGDRVDNTWPVAPLRAGSQAIYIGSDSRFLHTPPAFDAPLLGSRRNIAMPFSREKLEWCGYPIVKKNDAMFIRFDRIHERDRHTDGNRITT